MIVSYSVSVEVITEYIVSIPSGNDQAAVGTNLEE